MQEPPGDRIPGVVRLAAQILAVDERSKVILLVEDPGRSFVDVFPGRIVDDILPLLVEDVIEFFDNRLGVLRPLPRKHLHRRRGRDRRQDADDGEDDQDLDQRESRPARCLDCWLHVTPSLVAANAQRPVGEVCLIVGARTDARGRPSRPLRPRRSERPGKIRGKRHDL